MRILHCSKVYRPDYEGGIEEAISRLAAGTPSDSQTSILVCRTHGLGSRIVVDGIPVERTTTLGRLSSLPLSPSFLWRFRQRAQNADVVAFHAPFPLVDIGIRFGFGRQPALVIHWHAEIIGRDWMRPMFDPLLRHSIDRADRIIVGDQTLIDRSSYLRAAREKCRVAPFGIETEFWSGLTDQDRSAIVELRREYPRLIVACGRLVPYKGFDVLIRAMTRVDGHLSIIGTGPRESELRALARELGLTDKVTICGFLDRQTQKRMMSAARVFVLSSTTEAEAFGIAQLEGMACGLPIVNTNLPTAVPRVARDGKEALTVEPGDSAGLASAITRLLDNPELAFALGNTGQKRAREHYDWKRYAATVTAIYREAIAARQERRDSTLATAQSAAGHPCDGSKSASLP